MKSSATLKHYTFIPLLFVALLSGRVRAESEAATVHIDEQGRIQVPEKFRKSGAKLRIKNPTSGREVIVQSRQDEEFIQSDEATQILQSTGARVDPEVSVLESEARSSRPGAVPMLGLEFDRNRMSLERSRIYYRPIWKRIAVKSNFFKAEREKVEGERIEKARISAEQAAVRRKSLQEEATIRKLFEIGWKSVNARRYDLGLDAFSRLVDKKAALNETQFAQASLGRAISLFHQKGCVATTKDLQQAEKDPKNIDDVSYYRALCLVEAEKGGDAERLFQELVRKQHPQYSEPSRFYIGVIAEADGRSEDAEAAYLDTIDFAKDQNLVNLAKNRLANLRANKGSFFSKVVSFILSGSAGYDTNVISLPQSSTPSSINANFTSAKSANLLGLGLIQVRPPWSDKIDHSIRYSFMALHYLDTNLAKSYDIQVHDVGTSLGFRWGERNAPSISVGANSSWLGTIAKSTEFARTYTLEIRNNHIFGDVNDPKSDLDFGIKAAFVRPDVGGADASVGGNANGYSVSGRYSMRTKKPHVFGPEMNLEWKPAAGTENSSYTGKLGGFWDVPVGPDSLGLSLSQKAAFSMVNYFQSSTARKDYPLEYSADLVKGWSTFMETRLQFLSTFNFSSVSATYGYNRFQMNLLVSAFF